MFGDPVGSIQAASKRMFTVGEPGETQPSSISLYLDLRDRIFEASTNVMPVLCGDFMAAGGYYGSSVGAAEANWNPDNL